MHQNRSSSCRLPIVILCNSGPNQETSLPERVAQCFQNDHVGIIEHAVGNDIPSDSQSAPCAKQVRWLNDRYTCFNLKGNAVELLQHLAQRLHDGDLAIGGVIVTSITRHEPAEVMRILSENEQISSCFYIDTVFGTPDAEVNAQGGGNEAADQSMSVDGDVEMKLDSFEYEQAQLLLSRLRAASLAGKGVSQEVDRMDAAHEANVAAISSGQSDPDNSQDNGIGSFVFRSYRPFQFERLGDFMATALKTYSDSLLHYKGVLYFSGCANRVLFKGTGVRMTSEAGPEWTTTEARENTMIFVGHSLPREALAAGLEQCLEDAERAWKF